MCQIILGGFALSVLSHSLMMVNCQRVAPLDVRTRREVSDCCLISLDDISISSAERMQRACKWMTGRFVHSIKVMFASQVLSENLWIWFFGSAAFFALLGFAILLSERRGRRNRVHVQPNRPRPKEIDPSMYVLPEDSGASVQDMIEIKKMGGSS